MSDKLFAEDYECPQCGEKDLLVRGPRGRGPLTREGPIKDIIEDVGGASPKKVLRRLVGLEEAEVVDVRLQCQNCDFDETYPADDEFVMDIVDEG